MPPLPPPLDYPRIKIVNSFEELVGTPWAAGINALCWRRTLSGDYRDIVGQLGPVEGIVSLDEESLASLSLSEAGKEARKQLLTDLRLLQGFGLSPTLDCIQGYPEDDGTATVPTDVYSYHADRAPVAADTYLCTYAGASTEALRNEDSVRRIDIPDTRDTLLRQYGGDDDEGFQEYLREHCYDLHYAPLGNAQPFAFGLGELWRIAIAYPDNPVPPCVHRAPRPGAEPRLLLIS